MENHDVKQVEQRIKRYWYSDGIAELVTGGLFAFLGLYFGIQAYFGEGSQVSVILQVSMILPIMAGVFAVRWLVNTLKARLTYPRTGYVEYRLNDHDVRQRRLVIVAVALALGIASMVLIDYIRSLDALVLGTGLLAGLIFIALRGRSSGVKRFYALGGLSIVLGIILSFSSLSQTFNLALFYGFLGIVIILSGGLALRRYLNENPMPAENSNG